MGYAFQVVPLEKLKRLGKDLDNLEIPCDRQQALRVGACCLLINTTADECIRNIPEEKRRLATWTRNQRSMVRFVRYKGSSRMRGAMNADISNASDSAKSTLQWVQEYAPYIKEVAAGRLQPCTEFATLDDISMYVSAFQKELDTKHSSDDAKSLMWGLTVVGVVLLLIFPPIGGILLLSALGIYLANKDKWKKLADASAKRTSQLKEIKEQGQQLAQFDNELNSSVNEDDKEEIEKAISIVSKQLQSQYSFLDVACRELGSNALSWEQLAREVHNESITIDQGSNVAPQEKQSSASMQTKENGYEDVVKSGGNYIFKVNLDDAKGILKKLGYKRLPKEWMTISLTAEEKICKELAKREGIQYDNYYWEFSEGKITAELL